jgi:phosphoribosylformylglycinamidine cyclo-ligase
VIRGITVGCRYAGCSLIGGETAEMPGLYTKGEYDLAGTIVGVVDRAKIVDGSTIQEGDVVIGLQSSGLHTNGFSLARKICFEIGELGIDDEMPGVGRTAAEALMAPHRSYAKVIQVVSRIVNIKGMVHVTGGGITDNLPRTLPDSLAVHVDLNAFEALPIFRYMQETGNVEQSEMLRTFNCGLGFLVIVSDEEKERALDALTQALEQPKAIGTITRGDGKVSYSGALHYA